MDEQQVGAARAAASSNSSACAETPVAIVSTSAGAGHLQAVDAVVLEALGLEQRVDLGDDLLHARRHRATIPVWNTHGASGRGAAW